MVAAQSIERKKERWSASKFLRSKQWSQYQEIIFDFAVNGHGHGLVEARAGSAKSTSLVGIVASLPIAAKIAVVAFNVHSVADLSAKMPTRVKVSTAHKFGMSALVRFFQGELFQPNEDKMRDLCRKAIDNLCKTKLPSCIPESDLLFNGRSSSNKETQSNFKALRRSAASYLESIIHYAMSSLAALDVPSLIEMEEWFCVDHDFSAELAHECLLPMVDGLIVESIRKAIEHRDISLDELLYLPVKLELNFPAYDFVLFDEAQDASAVMIEFVARMAANGRLIAVSDRFQAIQGFAGSDAYSVDRIIDRFAPTQLPLSICYRCPSSHLDLARRLVPDIQDKPGAIAGEIAVIDPDRIPQLAKMGDLMICRFTAPLIVTCLDLIKQGIKARVRGRDIGSQMIGLAQQAEQHFPRQFLDALKAYSLPRIEQFKEDDRDAEARSLEDKLLAVIACFDSFGLECRTFREFCDRIQSLFCDDADIPPVTLATIHRSKGDESDRVWILGSNFLPYTDKAVHDWQVQQELNLTYVALTRSKQSLFLVPLGNNYKQFLSDPLGGMELPLPLPLPLPDTYQYSIDEWVALYHNPNMKYRVNSIDTPANTVTVQRGDDVVTVAIDRIKPLLPTKTTFA